MTEKPTPDEINRLQAILFDMDVETKAKAVVLSCYNRAELAELICGLVHALNYPLFDGDDENSDA